ncbi:MAG: FecR domain-containing protein [Bacteroidota bacterium]
MNGEKFLELTIKYLSNEASDSERDELNYLLKQRKYTKRFKVIRKEWKRKDASVNLKQFNTEDGLEKLNTKISKYDSRYHPQQKMFPAIRYVYRNVFVKTAISVALVLIISTIGLYYLGVFSGKSNSVVWNEKVTQLGEKSILTFLDGTKITLNAGSKLKYPSGSEITQREVYLEGEAFFEVARDTSRPFIVRTSTISTTVLGTKFDVCAYSVDREISVSLVEGNVKVSKSTGGKKEDIVILNPEQQLTYSKDEEISRVRNFDEQEATGWKDNVLKFTNEPLNKALIKLERFYGVKFELTKKSAANIKITANFKGDSFHTVAEVIKKLTGLKYKTITEKNEIRKVIFY